MLNLKNIQKDYVTSSETVHALRGVSIAFRQNEFVSILGPSGCGKTTLLNIVGGLDHYTSGDLVINGRSTKSYTDRDWDVYRNHRVGFIFQSYNLIPHQTILGNVELALTIAGMSKEERVAKAKKALDRVGLSDQYYKRPNQLSGGQCQRVAIARALVNDPEILLADEPTGALDTVTSVQIMELIKEISKERLVIMVTHNPELAEQYSSRIIRLIDGQITEDSNPFTSEEEEAECAAILKKEQEEQTISVEDETKKPKRGSKNKKEKAKMSFFTAFKLSLKNLFTKKGRTTLTAFAGSIGIIGIALILAVSEGTTAYINYVQESTLSAYPLTLESTNVDITALMESFMGAGEGSDHENDAVYKDPMIAELVEALSKVEANENDLAAFKIYLENELKDKNSELSQALSGVQYSYNLNMAIYTKNKDGKIIKSDTGELMTKMLGEYMMAVATGGAGNSGIGSDGSGMQSGMGMSSSLMSSMMGLQMWQELLPGLAEGDGERPPVNDVLKDQYDLIYGSWPEAKDEIILVLNEKNELDDLTLYALGLLSESEIDAIIDAAVNGTTLPESNSRWSYEEICNLTFRTILPYDCYMQNSDGTFSDMSNNSLLLNTLYNDALQLKVVGIIRPNEDAETAMLSGSIGYTYHLTEHVIKEAADSEVVKAQLANTKYDIISGLPFKENTGSLTAEQKKQDFLSYVDSLNDEEKAEVYVAIQCLKTEKQQLQAITEQTLASFTSKDAIVAMIIKMVEQESSVDSSTIAGYFENMTLDDLKELLRPSIEEASRERIHDSVKMNLEAVPTQTKIQLLTAELATATNDDFALYYDEITEFSTSTLDETLVKIGSVDLDAPFTINLFASTFENKDVIVDAIAKYNDNVPEEQKISYTDFLGIMMSSITTIINAITYVLIAFVAISLVVSSIMIGVITLISVQERTKEIGILRAIGASKRDVSSMFNAETIIIGLASGLLGILVTYLLCIPINIILNYFTGIANLRAFLPIPSAAILVLISVVLTLISGLIPSRSAAKKDPVVALRTE